MGNIFDRSVFLVDDEPELRRMVEQILKEAGFRDVLLASSCQEARRIFRTKTPQLVL
jgi:DNA-binding response OmpR family regulator